MRLASYLILLGVICGFGCATPYKSAGIMGGFSQRRLAEDMFRVNFRGNGYTSRERTQDFAMLRASELTLENGFKFFAVIDEENTTRVSTYTTSGTAHTTGSAFVNGPFVTYSGHTTYDPPTTHFIFKPRTGLLVRCFPEKPDGVYVFDAAFVRESIRAKFKIRDAPGEEPKEEPETIEQSSAILDEAVLGGFLSATDSNHMIRNEDLYRRDAAYRQAWDQSYGYGLATHDASRPSYIQQGNLDGAFSALHPDHPKKDADLYAREQTYRVGWDVGYKLALKGILPTALRDGSDR